MSMAVLKKLFIERGHGWNWAFGPQFAGPVLEEDWILLFKIAKDNWKCLRPAPYLPLRQYVPQKQIPS